MTALRKSDAQLDAEAATPISERPLEESLNLHRLLYRDELSIEHLTTESPPVFTDGHTGKRTSDPMSMIGPTLSWPLTRLLAEEYGNVFPWSRAASIMRYRLCRATHPEHLDRPEWRGSLCYELVTMTVRRDYSLPMACLELGTTPDRSKRVLHNALLWIERAMDAAQQKQQERQKPDKRLRAWWEQVTHDRLPGLHAEECPQCLRGHATLSSSLGI